MKKIVAGIFLTAFMAVFLLPLRGGVAAAEDFEGIIEPNELVKLSSQLPGIIEEIMVERGDVIKKDQVVARLKGRY